MIQFRSVTKIYGRSGGGLRDVTFRLYKGEFTFLTGPSGSGKTTALRLAHMQFPPDEGEVRVSRFTSKRMRRNGISELRRRVGYVFQDFRLLEKLTIGENVAFALEVTGTSRSRIKPKVRKLLAQVGLAAREQALPHELSGGEQQRVTIARALATDPLVLLADEPTGNLDGRATQGVFDLFRTINSLGTSILMATHDANLIRANSDLRVLELEAGCLVFDSHESARADARTDARTDLA